MTDQDSERSFEYDVLIIGSGFGGAVSAMRLAEKGYKVVVIESGKKYTQLDFAQSNWDFKKYLWLPLFRCFGIQKFTFLNGIAVMHGAGVGGGSLVYANTLVQPEDSVFKNCEWGIKEDLSITLQDHFKTAKKMLGVSTVPKLFPADVELKKLALHFKKESTFSATNVGVYFGDDDAHSPDPYFYGMGPSRAGCKYCGSCMVGCRHGAKNSLDKNYLYFAEGLGAKIIAETEVVKITPHNKGYCIDTRSTTDFLFKKKDKIFSKNVIVSAGALGTLKLLFECRDFYKTLPKISQTLGRGMRSNGESLLGATSFTSDQDFSKGVAIGSIFSLNDTTHVEAVRYPKGSNALKFLAVPLTPKHRWIPRSAMMLIEIAKRLPSMIKLFRVRDWASQSIILLVMQTLDQSMSVSLKKVFGFKFLSVDSDSKLPSYFPLAQDAAKALSEQINGVPLNIAPEVTMNMTVTAHILGGCSMGEHPQHSVMNDHHEVHGYPGLFVCDASVISSNLGVNPSLTITALSERFASLWPNQAEGEQA